jgi:hypothetical protein
MRKCLLLVLLLLLGFGPAAGALRIHEDGGGQIGAYLAKYRALRASGEHGEIDGTCASAVSHPRETSRRMSLTS